MIFSQKKNVKKGNIQLNKKSGREEKQNGKSKRELNCRTFHYHIKSITTLLYDKVLHPKKKLCTRVRYKQFICFLYKTTNSKLLSSDHVSIKSAD